MLVVALVTLILMTGCAPGPNHLAGTGSERGPIAGFWLGLWQGFIAPIVFFVSLFKSNLNIYEVHNSGVFYNLGYLFGLAIFFGGSGNKTRRRG
jgi:hypothetical protein